MLSFLKVLWNRFLNHIPLMLRGAEWAHDWYAEEERKARRMRLEIPPTRRTIGSKAFLRVLICPDDFGSLRLTSEDPNHYVILHRSSQNQGWQASYFNGPSFLRSRWASSPQQLLDMVRSEKYRLDSLLKVNGETLK